MVGKLQKATEMKHDSYNHTRWKHMWGWHTRGCVWDKLASEGAGKRRVELRTEEISSLSHYRVSNIRQRTEQELEAKRRTQKEDWELRRAASSRNTTMEELLGRKHKYGKLEKERDGAMMLQGREKSGAEGDFTVATDSSSFRSCTPSLAHDVDEEVSTPSRRSPPWGRKVKWRSWRSKEVFLGLLADPWIPR